MIRYVQGADGRMLVKVAFLGADPSLFRAVHAGLGDLAGPLQQPVADFLTIQHTLARTPAPMDLALWNYRSMNGLGMPAIVGDELEMLLTGASQCVLLVGERDDSDAIDRAMETIATMSYARLDPSRATLALVYYGPGAPRADVSATLERHWERLPASARDEQVPGPRWLAIDSSGRDAAPQLLRALAARIAQRAKGASERVTPR